MRKWLTNNKIFFETISTTFLGIMAIIVSYVSINVSQSQLKYEDLLNQPLIRISVEAFSYSGNENDSQFLIIENDGSPVTSFSSKLYTCIEIHATMFSNSISNSNSIQFQTIYVPIDDFFAGFIPSNNFKGELGRYFGLNNSYLLNKIETNLRRKVVEEDLRAYFNLIQYMQVSYKDYKGDNIRKLFKIDPVYQGFETERNEQFERCINEWNNGQKYSIQDFRAEDIFEIIKTKDKILNKK